MRLTNVLKSAWSAWYEKARAELCGRWFHDTLVDGDLAINSMMWQNAGKSGLDQWNFTLLPTSTSQVTPMSLSVCAWVSTSGRAHQESCMAASIPERCMSIGMVGE